MTGMLLDRNSKCGVCGKGALPGQGWALSHGVLHHLGCEPASTPPSSPAGGGETHEFVPTKGLPNCCAVCHNASENPVHAPASPATAGERTGGGSVFKNQPEWVRRLFVEYDVASYIDEYEFRGDEGDYTPNENERVVLIDAIAGVIHDLHEKVLLGLRAAREIGPVAAEAAGGGEPAGRDSVASATLEPASPAAPSTEAEGAQELKRLKAIIERDRSTVADGVVALNKAMASYGWLRGPGRGSYAFDDDRYQKEFGDALDLIQAAIEPLSRLAADWSDCPTAPADIAAARAPQPPVPSAPGGAKRLRGWAELLRERTREARRVKHIMHIIEAPEAETMASDIEVIANLLAPGGGNDLSATSGPSLAPLSPATGGEKPAPFPAPGGETGKLVEDGLAFVSELQRNVSEPFITIGTKPWALEAMRHISRMAAALTAMEGERDRWRADALNYSKAYGDAMERSQSARAEVERLTAEVQVRDTAIETLDHYAQHGEHCRQDDARARCDCGLDTVRAFLPPPAEQKKA